MPCLVVWETDVPHPTGQLARLTFAMDEFGISNVPLVKLFLFKIFSLLLKF